MLAGLRTTGTHDSLMSGGDALLPCRDGTRGARQRPSLISDVVPSHGCLQIFV